MLFPTIRLTLALLATTALANPVPEEGEVCGPTICSLGETCCNDSCGICTKAEGEQCTTQICPPTGPQCGPNQCYDGWECCNESCGICTPPGGGSCTEQHCEPEEEKPEEELESRGDAQDQPEDKPVQCGPNTCEDGLVCCNESCGICAPPDGACTLQYCFLEEEEELGGECGPNTCADNEYCCNSSCGYCRKEGEGCTKELCPSEGGSGEESAEGAERREAAAESQKTKQALGLL